MEDPLEQVDFGDKLDSTLVENGLRELCPDIHFDLAARRDMTHPWHERVQSVYYRDRYICAMDRGVIPEITVWANFKKLVEIPWYAADREDASISYNEIMPNEPGYEDLYISAQKGGDPSLMVNDKGKLLRLKAMGYEPVGRRCMRVGWRHTFAKIIKAGLPGITAESIAAKFGIERSKIGVLESDGVLYEEEPQWQQQ